MTVEIYIRGKQLEVYSDINYSLTKQVNEFSELRTRQWDFTDKYKIPKTAHNKAVFDFLSYAGNTSDLPYIKSNGAQLYFNGVPIIENGLAEISDSDDDYNLILYSGAVNLYDAIKDLTLQNLDWNSLDHDYGITTMENSFSNTDGYIYPLAITSEGQPVSRIWADRPSPSVFFNYILDRVQAISGITISGDIRTDSLFLKTVMTTERSVSLPKTNVTNVGSDSGSSTINNGVQYSQIVASYSGSANYYRVDISMSRYGSSSVSFVFLSDSVVVDAVYLSEDELEKEVYIYASTFDIRVDVDNQSGDAVQFNIDISVNRVDFGTVPVRFSELMPEMKVVEWLRYVLVTFGLNIYPNHDGSEVELNYLNNLDNADTVNQSKYIEKLNGEAYDFGSYASINHLEYTKEDSEKDASRGSFSYAKNIGDTKVHYTAPFAQPADLGGVFANYYFNDSGKQVSSRPKVFTVSNDVLGAELYVSGGISGKTVASPAIYEFDDLKYYKVVPRYYNFLQSRIFNAPLKLKVSMHMPLIVFRSLDFQKKYYLEQYGKEFLLNRATYNSRGSSRFEFIGVSAKKVSSTIPVAVISGTTSFDEPGGSTVELDGSGSYSAGGYIDAYLWEVKDNGVTILTGTKSDITFALPENTYYEVCLTVTNELGNTNTKCETVYNSYTETPLDIFDELETIVSDSCYTTVQFKITHDPNTTFTLRLRASQSAGEARAIVWNADASDGVNCQTSGCPVLSQISLPKFGPGVNEVHNWSDTEIDIPLDSNGEALVQIRTNAARDPNIPQNNYFGITAWHDASGYSKSITLRSWSATNLC